MEKELIINSTPTDVEIALLENGKLVELHYQKTSNNFSVGDIFLGKVQRLTPGLNAGFVDIGHKKGAFLHYSDLGTKIRSVVKFTQQVTTGAINTPSLDNFEIEPETHKSGKIDQVLHKRQNLLVQIFKEEISTKGPRLTCEITIPGRYLVLTPFNDVVAVSKKIANNEERKRLKVLIESIKPKNFGVIVRTAAEGKKVADLHEELTLMQNKWDDMYRNMHKAEAPAKLMSELDKTSSLLRDLLTDSFNRIVINEKDLYQSIRGYLSSIAPEKLSILQLHKGPRPVFESFNITRQIQASFGKTATMSSGAYLVIESTEAMHVIDVNSGHKTTSTNADEAALKVNLEAAEEIARQLRLRDIGGIIIIDFIDLRNQDHKKLLQDTMRDAMKKDRAQHTILPLSKFGLMQITRQRVRPEVKIDTSEVCPTCSGTGKMNAPSLIINDIERDLEYIQRTHANSKVKLVVHPFLQAYLTQGGWFRSKQWKWYLSNFKWVDIKADSSYHLTSYKFFELDDEIRLGPTS